MELLNLLNERDANTWRKALQTARYFDAYHTVDYCLLPNTEGSEIPTVLYQEYGQDFVGMPLLIRELPQEITGAVDETRDACSPYGYGGAVTSLERVTSEQMDRFTTEMESCLSAHGVVSVFARLHPLEGRDIDPTNGHIADAGHTVVLDLAPSESEQVARYRRDHRAGIRKLQERGARVLNDTNLSYFDDFLEAYRCTMNRVDAADAYYFSRRYFERLFAAQDFRAELYVGLISGSFAAGAVFLSTNDTVQYHLSGTREEYRKLAPTKGIIDSARRWATASGRRWLHLGGGVGGKRDSLFAFKMGFGGREMPFRVWQLKVLPTIYEKLLHAANVDDQASYFPAYRTPRSARRG